MRTRAGTWSRSLLMTATVIALNACALTSFWKPAPEREDDVWAAPNQRAITWFKNWGCFSATGSCSDVKVTDGKGRTLETWNPDFNHYVYRHYWTEAMLSELNFRLPHFQSDLTRLPEALDRWHRTPGLTQPRQFDFYRVSFQPEVVIAVESAFYRSMRANDIRSEAELRELLLAHTPAEALIANSPLLPERPSVKLTDTSLLPGKGTIQVLVDGPRGKFSREQPATEWAALWWFRLDQPQQAPQPVPFTNDRAAITLGNHDVLQLHRQADQIKVIRTTEP